MDEQQQQQLIQMGQEIMQKDPQLAQQLIQEAQQQDPQQIMAAAQQGDQRALATIAVMMAAQATQKLKFGAKLNYIKQLRGICPDGYEMSYFKAGGQLCKKCIAKQKMMEQRGEVPSGPVDAFKCGRKMKKKENGGNIDFNKCGSKMKKKACGGTMNKKISKKSDGGPVDPLIQAGAGTAKMMPRKKTVWSAEYPTVRIDPSGVVVNQPQGDLENKQAMQEFANDVYMQDLNTYNEQREAVQAAQQKANMFRNKVFGYKFNK